MFQQRAEVLAEQMEQAQKRIETNRRAVNLGLLSKANCAPGCSIIEADRQPCRAPAIRDHSFWVYQTRARDAATGQMQVEVVENRETMQSR
jgi:hypothetical protein